MIKKKVNNALYSTTISIGASKPKQLLWYVVNIIFFKNAFNISSALKVFLLKLFGATVGVGVIIKPNVNIKFPWKLSVGDHSWIGEAVWIDNLSQITIGNSVTLSQGALLLTGSHDHTKTTFDFLSQAITLEDGVWIGARAIVMGGVTCMTHSVLGVCGVTSKDLKPYIIYQGNPAVAIIERELK